MANHVETYDWSMVFWLAVVANRVGSLKVFAKSVIGWIPILGTGMRALGAVFLSRSWDKDKATILRTFEELNAKPVDSYWLLTHPEGTRVSATKLAESQAFARSRNLPVLQHLLLPRVKGFASTVHGLEASLESVLDVTICWDRPPSSSPFFFLGLGGSRVVHMHLARFPIKELPSSEEGLHEWLYARWVQKEALIASFKKHGRFEGEPLLKEVSFPRAAVDRRMFWWQLVTGLVSFLLFKRLLLG